MEMMCPCSLAFPQPLDLSLVGFDSGMGFSLDCSRALHDPPLISSWPVSLLRAFPAKVSPWRGVFYWPPFPPFPPFLILQIRSHRMRTKPRAHVVIAYSCVILVSSSLGNSFCTWHLSGGSLLGINLM